MAPGCVSWETVAICEENVHKEPEEEIHTQELAVEVPETGGRGTQQQVAISPLFSEPPAPAAQVVP